MAKQASGKDKGKSKGKGKKQRAGAKAAPTKRLSQFWHPIATSAEVTEQLFCHHLPQCAEAVLGAGLSLIVDATFLDRRHRRHFADLAARCGARFVILDCRCPPELARRRLSARQSVGLDPSDADLAVLERQLQRRDPLERSELASTLVAEASDADGSADTDRPDLSVAADPDDQALLERLVAALLAGASP